MKSCFMRALVAVSLFLVANVCAARSWHINNLPDINADFVDVNAAMASEDVLEGDTLYLGAGSVSGSQTLS